MSGPWTRIRERFWISLGSAVVAIAIFSPFITSIWLYSLYNKLDVSNGTKLSTIDRFLNSAQWIQALIAWFALIVISFTLIFLYEQIKKQKEQGERELYRPLISHETQAIKRFLAFPAVREEFRKLQGQLSIEKKVTKAQAQEMLEELRRRIRHIAGDIELPLLGGSEASLDHIEALINEYNYLSKLIADKKLRKEFDTDFGNFANTLTSVRPLIVLRQKIASNYASYFCYHCEGKEKLEP